MKLTSFVKSLYQLYLLRSNPKKFALKNGVQVGNNVRFTGKTTFGTEPYLISIGNHVLIAGCTFITHDGANWVLAGLDPRFNDTFGYGRITICDNVYLGHNCTILRGVTIGENTIVGACSLVNKSLEPNSVYAGVPARRICSIDEFRDKFIADMPEYDPVNYKANKKDEVLKIVDKFRKR